MPKSYNFDEIHLKKSCSAVRIFFKYIFNTYSDVRYYFFGKTTLVVKDVVCNCRLGPWCSNAKHGKYGKT